MDISKINGLIAAPFTPMYEDGSLNTGMIKNYAGKLKNDGVSGVFVCGTTGEGMLMTLEERKKTAEAWIKEQTNYFRVIVHTGTTSFKQSCELAAHAQETGAFAVGTMGPVFLPPSRTEELVGFCSEVASAAPDIPFYYYHIPSVSGIKLPMAEFLAQAAKKIPNLAGIKFSDNDFMDMMECIRLDDGKWNILHGYDELLLAGLSFGVKGAVGSTYNFMARLYYNLIDSFENGDIDSAREYQAMSIRIINILVKYGGAIVMGKALMKSVGVDCGPVRLPLKNPDKAVYDKFIAEIKNSRVEI
jgi:N-acetylneuraminate lyase